MDIVALMTPENLMALFTLTILEIVLGIDNIIFISLLSNKLPEEQQGRARTLGIGVALGLRLLLLMGIRWIIGASDTLFTVFENDISGRDLILLAGGIFLIAKATTEIHHKSAGEEEKKEEKKKISFSGVIVQIALIDLVFSFDSILTAVGMVQHIEIMVAAIIISMAIMLGFAKKIGDFISKHVTVQILALSFLILIGFILVVEAFDVHVPKGYIYFALFFALLVEMLNLWIAKKRKGAK